MDKKFSEQSLIQLLHAAMENRWEAGFNQDLSSLLSTTHDLSMYSIAEAFWFIELAKALARNHDPRGVELVQKMFTDHVLATFYAKQTPGTSSLGDEMRAILGNFGAKETLTWLSRVEGQNYSSALYPYPSPPLKVEMPPAV